MNRPLYPYNLSVNKKSFMLLWVQADAGDAFYSLDDEALFVARDKKDIKKKLSADALAAVKWEQSRSLDLDEFWKKVAALQVQRSSSTQTCLVLHNGWNFFDDLLRTFARRAALKQSKSPVLEATYKKLFLGCNLKSVATDGESYHPQWKAKEIAALKEYFEAAWVVFEKRVLV